MLARYRLLLLVLLCSLSCAVTAAAQENWSDTAATAQDDSLPVIDDTTMPSVEEVAPVIDSISRQLIYDSSEIALRHPSAGTMKRFREDDDFVYDRKKPNPPTDILGKILRWLNDRIGSMMPEGSSKTFWDWTAWIVVGAAVVIVIMNLSGIRGIFLRKPERGVSDFAEIEENIDAMDFNALIDEAVAARNFRRGVRLLYLKSLKDLSDRALITVRREKTNHDYIAELRAADLHESFRYVTTLFEYVWYGDVPVNESIFSSVRERFADFSSNLTRHREAL